MPMRGIFRNWIIAPRTSDLIYCCREVRPEPYSRKADSKIKGKLATEYEVGRGGQVERQGSAKPLSAVRFRPAPPFVASSFAHTLNAKRYNLGVRLDHIDTRFHSMSLHMFHERFPRIRRQT